jgi:hypothetical protein
MCNMRTTLFLFAAARMVKDGKAKAAPRAVVCLRKVRREAARDFVERVWELIRRASALCVELNRKK